MVGPRFALNITALRAKIGSVVPTALIFIFALRAKMSLCMESVESGCLEAGRALRLILIENFNENCIDAGLLHTNYRELTANYHLIIGGITGITGIGGIGGCTVLKKVYRFILSGTLMTGDVESS